MTTPGAPGGGLSLLSPPPDGAGAMLQPKPELDGEVGEEMVGLLEDTRVEFLPAGTPTPLHTKRPLHAPVVKERQERHERKRKESHAEGPGATETFWWLWKGSPHAGILCIGAACLCYSFMGVLVTLVAVNEIPTLEAVALRCAVGSILGATGLKKLGHPFLGTPSLRPLLLARAVLGFLSMTTFLYSLHGLSGEDTTVLSLLSPILTAVVARAVLQEKWGMVDMAGAVLCFFGTIFVMQPISLFRGRGLKALLGVSKTEGIIAAAMALVSALLAAGTNCTLRALGKSGEPPLMSVFAFAVFSCPAALVCLLLFQRVVVPSFSESLGMLVVGAVAFAAQVLLARGLQLEKAASATVFQYLMVPFSFLLTLPLDLGRLTSYRASGLAVILLTLSFVAYGRVENGVESRV